MPGVSDGQNATAAVFDAAFMARNGDTDTTGKVDLNNADSASGAVIANMQRAINAAFSFIGGSQSGVYNQLPAWTQNNLGSSTDDLFDKLDLADRAFSASSGHSHDGSSGSGGQISASDLSDFNNFVAALQSTTFDSAVGVDDDVSASFAGQAGGGDDAVEGIYTTAPNNFVRIVKKSNGEQIEDAGGQIIYGRLTKSGSVWTLTYYTNEAGTETSASMPANDLRLFYRKVFTQANRPTAGADILTVESLDFTADIATATAAQSGKVSTTAQSLGGEKELVDGLALGPQDVASSATINAMSSSKSFVRITGSTVTALNGIAAPSSTKSKAIVIYNAASVNVTVNHQSGSASSGNKIITPTGAAILVEPNNSLVLIYDQTQTAWVFASTSSGSGSGGSGSGGINYITNFNFETDASGWSAYADAAGASPVNGTGGSPTVTVTRSTSSPLRDTGSGLVTKDAANRQGEGVSYDFTVDSADKSKQLSISFDYEASANYTGLTGTEYMVCYIYDVTNSVLIATSNIYMPQGSGTQKITFLSNTSTSYRLIFHVATTGTAAWTYKFDNVVVGPQEMIVAPAVSDIQSYTPTISNVGTTSNLVAKWWQIADRIYVKGSVNVGTPAADVPRITLPNNYTIDSSELTATARNRFGLFTRSPLATEQYNISSGDEGHVVNDGSTATRVALCWRADNYFYFLDNADTFLATGQLINFEFSFKAAGITSGVALANSGVEYASNTNNGDNTDTTSFSNDSNGSPIPASSFASARQKRVRFKNPVKASDSLVLQVKPNNAIDAWFDIGGMCIDAGSGVNTDEYDPTSNAGICLYAPTAGTTTDFDVVLGRYQDTGSVNWNASNTSRWRVKKSSDASPVKVGPFAANYVISSENTSQTITSGSLTDATNLSCTITTTGRPVRMMLIGGVSESQIQAIQNTTAVSASIAFLRDGSVISQQDFEVLTSNQTQVAIQVPASAWQHFDTPNAGTYTYKVQAQVGGSSSQSIVFNSVKLVVWEI